MDRDNEYTKIYRIEYRKFCNFNKNQMNNYKEGNICFIQKILLIVNKIITFIEKPENNTS